MCCVPGAGQACPGAGSQGRRHQVCKDGDVATGVQKPWQWQLCKVQGVGGFLCFLRRGCSKYVLKGRA